MRARQALDIIVSALTLSIAAVPGVRAADGTWTGAAGTAWASAANWSGAGYPSGADTATFSGSGNGNTVIDLFGLSGIAFITFSSPGAAAYTLGAGSQTLVMGTGGRFQVEADTGNSQTVNAAVRLGTDAAAGAYAFRNDSASRTLTFAGGVSGSAGGAAGVKTLTVSGAGDTTLSGTVADGGASAVALLAAAQGTVTLSGANSHSGGTAVESGALTASHAQALGTGPVVNDGTLNLTVAQATYTGLSQGLSGTGSVNVKLGSGTGLNVLDGDTSGFTGVWNLGVGSAAGRARMNGADNAAATVHVLSNASLYVSGPVVKHATAILHGGNVCDQLGQLRLEDGAEWAGPVIFAGDITDPSDGLIGNDNGGIGIVSGPISDLNGPHVFEKRLTGTLELTATNSTYAGWTWCRGGSLIVTALGNLGEPSSLGAAQTAENNVVKLGSANTTASLVYKGAGGATDRTIDLSGDTGGAIIEQAGAGRLKLTGGLAYSGQGNKTLTLRGSTDGDGELCASYENSGGATHTLAKSGTGTWILSGTNTHSGETQVNGGRLLLPHPKALSGAGVTRFISRLGAEGVVEMAHDGAGEVPFNVTVGVGYCGKLLSGVATGDTGINHNIGILNLSLVTVTVARADNVLNGSPSITAQSVNLSGGGAHTTTLNPTTADLLIGSVSMLANPFRKTLRLAGESAGSGISGVIDNGVHTINILKEGSGTWSLTGANTYTGVTTVTSGTLSLAGANGAITASDSVVLSGNGMLVLDNTATVNGDRLGDLSPVTLAGGTLELRHAGGAADYGETAGALTVAAGSNRVVVARADEAQTGALTFASLARTGGSVDFAGAGLGQDARNQVLFTAAPALTDGVIGPWATVNGVLATYGVYGVAAFDGYAELSAKGPSVVPDAAAAHARISSEGAGGGITLETAVTGVGTLTQDSAYPATVSLTNATLRTAGVRINGGGAALTLGDAPGDGTLTALTDGGELLLGNDSSAALTVKAALADNGGPSALTAVGSGPIVLKGAVLHTGNTAIESGELTFDGHEFPQAVSSVISGGGSLGKSGTNLLHLLAANTYAGATVIRAGVVRPNQNTAFGAASGGVTVSDGATLDVGCTPDVGGTRAYDSLNLGAERFMISGFGADGRGVIVNSSTGRQYSVFGQIALTGDAAFGGVSDWRIRYNSPLLALGDHTLTKLGTNYVDLYSVTVEPGAGHIDVAEGALRLLYGTRMNGTDANTVRVRSGATLDLHNLYPQNAPVWRLNCQSNATLRIGQGVGATNTWAGPITLDGPLNLIAGGGYRMTLTGPVSGTGSLVKNNSSWVTLSHTESTFDGSSRILNGRLVVSALRNVGQPSSLGQPSSAEKGAIIIGNGTTTGVALDYVGTGDTSDRVITMGGTTGGINLYQNGTGLWKLTSDLAVETAGAKGVAFRGDGAAPGEFAGRITNVGGNAINVTKYDSGTWILSGTNSYSGSTTKYGAAGVLMFTGRNTCSGSIIVYGGTLHIAGENAFTGAQSVNGGELVFSGANAQGANYIYAGSSSSSNGIVRVLPGGNVSGTGKIRAGSGTGSAGALYVSGGSLARVIADGADTFNLSYGQNSYGYLNVSGGAVTNTRLQVGGVDTSTAQGVGVVRMTGGLVSFHKWLLLGRNVGSVGVMTLDGGEVRHVVDSDKRNLALCYDGGRAELNLTGGLLHSPGSSVSIRQYNTGIATGTVNLCAGTLFADSITNRPGVSSGYVNFAGGTFKAGISTPVFLTDALTGVTVYGPFGTFAGGAVIDTDGKDVTISAPLQAPSGSGVAGVALTDGGSGYIGEPVVTIEGGGGFGATAVANMEDDGTGGGTYRVASITLTCPGQGYTEAPAVTFLKGGNAAVAPTVASVTLAANTSGGLTKRGAGTLTLSAANTYGGATTISGGTLQLGHAAALPTQTAVVLDGGALDLGGYTVTNALGGSGTVVNGAVADVLLSPAGAGAVGAEALTLTGATLRGKYLADVMADGSSDRVDVTGDIDLSGLTLELVAPEKLTPHKAYTLLTCTGIRTGLLNVSNLPDSRWHLVYLADGTVKLVYVEGTLIIMK